MPYLHRDVQGVHNLPNHKGQDVDNQQDPHGGIELPGLQVLLGYKNTTNQLSIQASERNNFCGDSWHHEERKCRELEGKTMAHYQDVNSIHHTVAALYGLSKESVFNGFQENQYSFFFVARMFVSN